MTSDTIVVPLVQPYCVAGSWPYGWAYLVDFANLGICCPFFRYWYTLIIFYVTVWWLSTYTCFISISWLSYFCRNSYIHYWIQFIFWSRFIELYRFIVGSFPSNRNCWYRRVKVGGKPPKGKISLIEFMYLFY